MEKRVPLPDRGTIHNHVYETVPLIDWGTEIVPLRVPYYTDSQIVLLGVLFRYPFF